MRGEYLFPMTSAVATHRELFGLVCLFNHSPAAYIHPSRRASYMPAPVDESVWSCGAAMRHLSRLILERLAVRPCMELARPEWKLALLGGERLERLARHVAAALVSGRARRCLSRAEVMMWRQWLGTEAHEFALNSASLLPAASAAPGVETRMSAQELGYDWIRAATLKWPDEIGLRLQLKLPAREVEGAVNADASARLVRSILPVVEQSWCLSFATART